VIAGCALAFDHRQCPARALSIHHSDGVIRAGPPLVPEEHLCHNVTGKACDEPCD
jgi:hypothetical protein